MTPKEFQEMKIRYVMQDEHKLQEQLATMMEELEKVNKYIDYCIQDKHSHEHLQLLYRQQSTIEHHIFNIKTNLETCQDYRALLMKGDI